MKINYLFFLLIPFLSLSQNQIGSDIDGEAANDLAGHSVSLSSNGSVVAIGAYGNGNFLGHVRVYENISGVWTQVGSDIDGEAANDLSGFKVSLSSDGSIVAISAIENDGNGNNSGQVRIYENVSEVWTQIGSDIDGEAVNDLSGNGISLSSDGSVVAIGASVNDGNGNNSGHVRIYENISGVWTQVGLDIDGEAANDLSGFNVSLSSDGNIVAIGASGNRGNGINSGHVRIYENISGVWIQIGSDIDGEAANDLSGSSVSLSSDGSVVAIGAIGNDGNGLDSGHVRIYENISGVWIQIGSDIDGEAANDLSGSSVSLSSDGNIVAIGASDNKENGNFSGHVRIYKNVSGVWTQIGSDIDGEAVNNYSGYSVSLSSNGNIVAIGAYGNGSNSGHVRVYDLSAVLSTESFNQDYFSIYPNPAQNELELKLKANQELEQINIYSALGKYLYSETSLSLDISHLSSGLYIIEVETNRGKSSKKILKE